MQWRSPSRALITQVTSILNKIWNGFYEKNNQLNGCRMWYFSTVELWLPPCHFSPTLSQPSCLTWYANLLTRSSSPVTSFSRHESCTRAFTFKDKREKTLLLQEGTIGSKMYFVQEGIVDIVLASGEVRGKILKSSSSLVVQFPRKFKLSNYFLLSFSFSVTNDSTCRWRPLWVTDLTSVRSVCWPRPGGWRVWGPRPTATSTAFTRNTSMRSSRVIPSWREPWRVWQLKGKYWNQNVATTMEFLIINYFSMHFDDKILLNGIELIEMNLLDDLITIFIYQFPDWIWPDPVFLFRLHKIGKNPHLVSSRATLESDCRQISDIVSALAQAGSGLWINTNPLLSRRPSLTVPSPPCRAPRPPASTGSSSTSARSSRIPASKWA